MKLSDLKENDYQLDELLPTIGAVASGVSNVAGTAPGTTQAPGQAASGLATGQMNPAQAAQAAKQRMDQKKQIQDAIKQKQQELSDLQKQLAQIG